MPSTSTPIDVIATHVGWALVHFAWQAAAIAMLLKFCLRRMPDRSPEVRYLIAVIALGIVAVAPFATYAINDGSPQQGALLVRGELNSDGHTPTELPTTYFSLALSRADLIVGPWIVLIAAVWGGGMLLFLVWRAIGWWRLESSFAPSAMDGPMVEEFRSVAQKMHIRRVGFARTGRIDSPATYGWWKPMVILPEAAIATLPPDQLLALVAHELAHIQRRDYLVNLLQTVSRSIYFLHPSVNSICRIITAERESCCDDAAVQIAGKAVYRRALAAAEEMRHTASLALSANDASVVERVSRLTAKNQPSRGSWAHYVASPLLMVVALMLLTRFSRSDEVWWAIQQHRPAGSAMYDALGIAGHSQAFLAPLANAIAAKKADDQQLLAVARAITVSASADELANLAKSLGPTYLKNPAWPYGQTGNRMMVCYRMGLRAKSLSSADPIASRLLARGALALSIQELELTKVPTCVRDMEDPALLAAAALTEHEGHRLRLAMLEYQRKVNVGGEAKQRQRQAASQADSRPE